MPADSKKNSHKSKHDPKDQRKPRGARHQAAAEKKEDKISEKKSEEPKVLPPSKPVTEEPGPEFYKSLKRETEEIVKITEEANSKYKKKEIQSNWSKYEMPIESYEEIDAMENMGADYEKLIETPLSIGSHFQFKHEKNWDISTGPSLYDRYFEIDMDNLAVALCTVPFYERNKIDRTMFSATDMLTMDNRSIRYKRKYYDDKSFSTTELDAQDKIVSAMKESSNDTENIDKSEDIKESHKRSVSESKDIVFNESRKSIKEIPSVPRNDDKMISDETVFKEQAKEFKEGQDISENSKILDSIPVKLKIDNIPIDDLIVENTASNIVPSSNEMISEKECIPEIFSTAPEKSSKATSVETTPGQSSNPVMESPEDLEKWLDDFLDG